jgi:hypothetical protein
MLSFACRRFRAGFTPGSSHPHRRDCRECETFAVALESAAGVHLPLPPGLRRNLRAIADPEPAAVLPFAVPRLAVPDALAARLRGMATPRIQAVPRIQEKRPVRRALPEWARSPRYAIAASALLAMLLGPYLSSAAQRGRQAFEAVQSEVSPILERTGESGRQEAGKLRSTAAAACDTAERSVASSLERFDQRLSGLSARLSDVVPERFINLGSGGKPPESVRRPQ